MMITGTMISHLPTGTIDSLNAIFPMDIGMPSNPQTIQESILGLVQFLGSQGVFLTGTVESGWVGLPAALTYRSSDAPSYKVDANASITGSVGLGNKIQLQHLGSTKNFFVTDISVSGTVTSLNLYGGTDYTLTTGSITSPNYSHQKAPFGFPLDPEKWTVTISNTSLASQSSPTQSQWYNLGGINIVIPIGIWRVYYELAMNLVYTSASAIIIGERSTLSTTNNGETDTGMSYGVSIAAPAASALTPRNMCHRERIIGLAAKTTYYLNALTGVVGLTSIAFEGNAFATTIKAICVYL